MGKKPSIAICCRSNTTLTEQLFEWGKRSQLIQANFFISETKIKLLVFYVQFHFVSEFRDY